MRKVKCDRKSNSCSLSVAPHVQYGRGGMFPVAPDYVVPLHSVRKIERKRKSQSGGGKRRKKGGRKKSQFSSSKASAKSGSRKKKSQRKRKKKN